MNIETVKPAYSIGADGIGMSTLVCCSLFKGRVMAGYDRTPIPLTKALTPEDAQIHYEENVDLIPEACKDKENTLAIYTPAVPQEHEELVHFRNNGFETRERAQVLGTITHSSKGLYVANTHGKTTTSTITAHLFHQSHMERTAFLGGISKNYGTNLLFSQTSPYTVIEADEFNRSFHWLSPYMTMITSTDPDHPDIYGTEQAYLEGFKHYTALIQPSSALITRKNISLQPGAQLDVRVYTYPRNGGDLHAENIRIGNGGISIGSIAPDTCISDTQLEIPISVNVENGVAAMALAHLNGVTDGGIKRGTASFRGVGHRLDFEPRNDRIVFLNDHVHHPSEIGQSVLSICELYKDREITAIFQPHLYTRTRDFCQGFADSLSLFDGVILVDIYLTREASIPDVTNKPIYDNLRPGIEKSMCKKEEILNILKDENIGVLVTLGTGGIDNYVPEIEELLGKR